MRLLFAEKLKHNARCASLQNMVVLMFFAGDDQDQDEDEDDDNDDDDDK